MLLVRRTKRSSVFRGRGEKSLKNNEDHMMQNLVKGKQRHALTQPMGNRMRSPDNSSKSPVFAVVTSNPPSSVSWYTNVYFFLLLNARFGVTAT